MAVLLVQYFSTLFGIQTHFQNTQGLHDLYAVAHKGAMAHQLRTNGLESISSFQPMGRQEFVDLLFFNIQRLFTELLGRSGIDSLASFTLVV